jgi:CubicO group peptidase (beta-lactamase class C family)
MTKKDKAYLSDSLDRVFTEDDNFSGSVLITKSGMLLLKKGYGLAVKSEKIENSSSAKFLIGSVTKQFTGMSVMQLYANKLIDIEDVLSNYLPDFPHGDKIKLIHLISHSSGIIDYANEATKELAAMPVKQVTKEDIIRMVQDKPLNFDPGTQFRYSNTGYLVLGYIIEKVSGLSYDKYLKDNIFDPLRMTNTGVFDMENPPVNLATGYSNDSKPVEYFKANPESDNFNTIATLAGFGAGCLYSNIEDLYIWNQTMKSDRLLSQHYMNLIFTPYETEKLMAPYGFGWRITNDVDFGKLYSHGGGIPGYHSMNLWYVDQDITIVILENTDQMSNGANLVKASMKLLI